MSAPFTSLSLPLDWSACAFLNELQGAYSERRQALGQSAAADIAAGEDVQALNGTGGAFPGIRGWQLWLQTYCTSFVNHTSTIAGAASVPMFTLADWRSVATLHADGFRRATTWPADWTDPADPAYSHGLMQAGDILDGPWIWQDLQRAFGALRWSKQLSTEAQSAFEERLSDTSADQSSAAAADAAAASLWSAASWSGTLTVDTPRAYYANGARYYFAGVYRAGSRDRVGMKAGVSLTAAAATMRPYAADLYILPALTCTDPSYDGDIDALGLTSGALFLVESFPSSSDPQKQATNWLGKSDTAPIVAQPINYPDGSPRTYYTQVLATVATSPWVLKWDFTHE